MPSELATTIVTPVKAVSEPPVIALKTAPVEAVRPTGEGIALTEVVEFPPAREAAAETSTQTDSMPQTASQLPLLGLLGLLSLGAGVALWAVPKA
jgi:hypothetical protein